MGSINNTDTGCGCYANYTSLYTVMEIDTGYTITVTNSNPSSSDECGIWVDWNQDMDFYDAGETIAVSGSPGVGPYTATITPPADANLGDTRMRILIGQSSDIQPCGPSTPDEVEDYTIIVTDELQTLKVSGHVTLSDGTPLSGVLLEAYYGPFTPSGLTDMSDENGYYEITLDSPWTGHIKASKDNYGFSWVGSFEDVTTDQIQNFGAYYTYSGGFGISGSPYLIATPNDMQAIGAHPETWDKYFILTNDIDLSGTTYSSAIIPSFSGQFDGAGFSVLNLQSNSGLFGYIKNAVIKNLGIENVEISNAGIAGPLCRSSHGGTIENCFSTGNISGFYDIGGLCAWVHTEYLGEYPIGEPLPPVDTPVIKNCYSTVNVTLIHPDSLPEFSTSSAGGLCAYAEGAELFNNYACGSVDGTGCDTPFGWDIIIDNGGLVGNIKNCNVYNNYSSGYVVDGRAYSNPGGFCGSISGDPTNFVANFWDNTINPSLQGIGNAADPNVMGESTVKMQMESTFTNAGWDFNTPIWKICDGTNYPKLAWQISLLGDFVCPDGVEINDLAVLVEQWLLEKLSADISPDGGNGFVDFTDWAVFANAWQSTSEPQSANWNPKCDIAPGGGDGIVDMDDLTVFVNQWLQLSAYCADIAPESDGDGTVDMFDFAILANNWLEGVTP